MAVGRRAVFFAAAREGSLSGAARVLGVDDASQDGLGGDGCRDRFLHAELKLLAENPPLRARAPREPCTGPIEAHGKQFFIVALEEVGSLAIIRCISHSCLFEDAMERPKQCAGRIGRPTLSRGPYGSA